MRDLYKRLCIEREASAAEVESAVQGCPHYELREDARAVFQSETTRRDYDALHDLLSDVGRLRADLGMTHAPHWRGSVALDFTPAAVERRARRDSLNERLDDALAPRRRFPLSRFYRRKP